MANKVEVVASDGVTEIILREGKANDVHIPGAIEVAEFTIDAVTEYLSKKGVDSEAIPDSYIWYSTDVDNSEPFIQLQYSVRREKPDVVHGKLSIHPDLKKFGINGGGRFTTHELANFIRLHRHFFESKDTAMALVKELQNFKARVDKEIEKAADNRGNMALQVKQTVISNVPLDFTLYLPIFKGMDKVSVKCEIDIDAADLACSLVSPDLKEMIDVQSEAIIKKELDAIRELHPDLKIFRK
jgi:hypothetical protein